MAERSTLVRDVTPGSTVTFAGVGVSVEVMRKSGARTRLKISAPRDVRIDVCEAPEAIAMRCTTEPASG